MSYQILFAQIRYTYIICDTNRNQPPLLYRQTSIFQGSQAKENNSADLSHVPLYYIMHCSFILIFILHYFHFESGNIFNGAGRCGWMGVTCLNESIEWFLSSREVYEESRVKILATEYSEGADIEGDRQAHDVQIYVRCGRVWAKLYYIGSSSALKPILAYVIASTWITFENESLGKMKYC
jgi:hypothetical protein